MNGCLFKGLLTIVFIIVVFLAYPHIKKMVSSSASEEINGWKMKSEIARKFFKYFDAEEKIEEEVGNFEKDFKKKLNNDNSKN